MTGDDLRCGVASPSSVSAAMMKWTCLMTALFAFACGSKLDTKYTDEGIAAADALCACLKVPDEAFLACAKTAREKLGTAEKAMIDRGYFNDHNDAAPMKAFKERAELCRNFASEASAMAARRDRAPDVLEVDPAAVAKAAKEIEALGVLDKKAAAKPAAAKPAPTTKPTARRKPAPAKTKSTAPAPKSPLPPGSPEQQHGPLWAK
jgi:hypothetical protein